MANIVHRDSIYRPTDRLLYKYWALRMRDISATAKRALVVVATICAVYAAAPALNLGFVSDDYIHLSVDRNKPWYFSSDHLYRPLRSGFFKLMAASFGLEPQPYRVLTLLAYLVCAVLFYRYLRALKMTTMAATMAALLGFFTPRNHELLFWFSAVQDQICVIWILALLLCWIRFRQRGSRAAWVGSVFFLAVALGFKEIAIIAPVLAYLTDRLFVTQQSATEFPPEGWLPYCGFAVTLILYAAFVYSYPDGLLHMDGASTRYGPSNASVAATAEVRSALNLVLSFEPAFALRDIGLALTVKLAVVIGLLAALAVRSRSRIWPFAIVWVLAALAPTSAFAGTVNDDRYLFLAGLGLAAAIGGSVSDIVIRSRGLAAHFCIAAVCIYCIAGAMSLARYRELWRTAAATTREIVKAVETILPNPGPAQIDFVNVPREIKGIAVVNNGLGGAFLARGYREHLQLNINHESTISDPVQDQLIAGIRNCSMTDSQNDRHILLMTGFAATDHTGSCAGQVIAEDMRARPWAWYAFPRRQAPPNR